MSLNINVTTRRKQLAILIGIIVVGSAVAAGVVMWGGEGNGSKNAAPAPVPNMTGVVTAAFDEQVNQSALQQQQAKTSAIENQITQLTQMVSQNKLDFDTKLQKKDAEIQRLTEQLNDARSGKTTPPATQAAPDGTPLPGPVSAGQARPPQYSVTPANGTQYQGGNINPGQGGAFYPAGSGRQLSGGMETSTFTYANLKKKPTKLPWIPTGSFSDAVMIEGADANASVTGNQQTTPVTFRLQGKVQMPNNHEYDMDGCFVSGEIWGDISSERGDVRTSAISCILKNGRHVDMPFKGHVSYQGKGGIKGKPVMRNGKIVGYAGAAGFLSGIGEGVKSAATPSVGLGATASVSGLDVLKQGFGGGSDKAADTLSQYWIKRAEQYHPVLDIGAGNRVTVVFQEGFRLETIEDAEENKLSAEVQKASNSAQSATEGTTATSSTAPATSGGVLNPDEVLKQARQLQLGDTIN
ncbi:F-type conjugal transfer pilus assembly protein TraB [Cronobacter sakazakii]|uniref:F-type conjugal transfer pilus assembly protein TraB n=1 Tax=Cronobacter sakazakii TaxID=28141 RepID=UPI000CF0D3D8|nr:F-type conjugal transfer pilus assembly protein TraB [Cronobacter sakazakii]NHV92163.1 F-type conjugal transfer pilus assembly protein TraB [Cronobacter sakazakii]PPY02255.1 conjugal transfer protein TraB [Cronobacter sakazakii]